MGLIELCIILAVIGILLYCFNRFATWCDAGAKKIINIVVIVAMVLIALQAFGLFNHFHDIRVPQV